MAQRLKIRYCGKCQTPSSWFQSKEFVFVLQKKLGITFVKFLLPKQCPKFGISKQYPTVSWNFRTLSRLTKTPKPKWLLLSYCRQLWWSWIRICGRECIIRIGIKSLEVSSQFKHKFLSYYPVFISKLNLNGIRCTVWKYIHLDLDCGIFILFAGSI